MVIESCYITGYGIFVDKQIDFTDGLNVIVKDNGWGKSTLCSFITSMLYGNPASKKTKIIPARRKYKPWSGGIYGGSMNFRVGDKRYRVERTFADKEKDDTFALYDEATNLISDDYSKNLGEELFEIDRDSFTKSIYIPQNDIMPAMTGAINGKLGDLVTVQDDINNFDGAINKINDEIKIYDFDGKENKGKSQIVKSKINELTEEAEIYDSLLESEYRNHELLQKKEKRRDELNKEKDELKAKITKQSEMDQKRGEYNSVLKLFEEEKKELDELDDFFVNGIPENEEFKEYYDIATEIDVLQGQIDKIHEGMPDDDKIEELKRLFDEPIDDSVIDDWTERANRLSELRVQKEHAKLSDEDNDTLQELKYYFNKKKPTKEELDIIREEAENVNRLQGRVAETKGYYEQQKHLYEEAKKDKTANNKSTIIMAFVIGAVILIGSIISIIAVGSTTGLIIGIAGIVIALIMFGVGILSNKRKNSSSKELINELEQNYNDAKEKYEQTNNEYETSERICREFLSDFLVNPNGTMQQMISDIQVKAEKYDKLLADEKEAVESGGNALEQLSEEEMSLYNELNHCQNVYGVQDLYSTNAEIELIQRIKEDNKLYKRYFEDDKERSEIIKEREADMKKITAFLNTFPNVQGDNINQKITYITTEARKYEELSEKASKHKEVIDKFLEENEGYESDYTVEELQEKETKAEEDIKSLELEIKDTLRVINEVSEKIEFCENCSSEIEDLKEELEEYNAKVSYLKKTKKYLTEAKNDFLSTYMRPMQQGMQSYLKMIDPKGDVIEADAFRIDTNLNVAIRVGASTKEAAYLSEGYRDLAAFCARLALVDIMYEKQQPILVVDDPFTNYDEDKIEMALKLMEQLSDDRQILYFTCHKSRT